MIFQRFNLLMQRNCLDNVCFPMEIVGVKRAHARKRAKELLEIVGLAELKDETASNLPYGQQRRLEIARALAANLASDAPDRRICVTTIQKLSSYLKHPDLSRKVLDRHTVFIFDECHRSQFGKMHTAITKSFRNYHLFGFTGTPIFAENAGSGTDPDLRTTAQAFGDRLHTYTVVGAISDGNVLPFKIDYVSTFRRKDTGEDVKVEAIDTDPAALARRLCQTTRQKHWLAHPKADLYLAEKIALFQRLYR